MLKVYKSDKHEFDALNSLNLICEKTIIDGSITSGDDIRISGQVFGDLNCNGKIIIASEGMVEGELNGRDVVIAGKFTGKIISSNRTSLTDSAVVFGDVFTRELEVAKGVKLNGSCVMRGEADELLEENLG
jgi:cytoskeletal protein CcmA (bactofilin family)